MIQITQIPGYHNLNIGCHWPSTQVVHNPFYGYVNLIALNDDLNFTIKGWNDLLENTDSWYTKLLIRECNDD